MRPVGRGQSAAEQVAGARRLLAVGRERRALDAAWDAALAAMGEGDETSMAAVRDLALEIAERAEGRVERRAETLAAYCRHCLQGAGGGVRREWILARLFGGRRRSKRCPDCAEAIDDQAHVCRFCGYRYDT